jgi:hypothetical protein
MHLHAELLGTAEKALQAKMGVQVVNMLPKTEFSGFG